MQLDAIDQLLDLPAFDTISDSVFTAATSQCVRILRDRFPRYAEFLDARSSDNLPPRKTN